MNHPTGSGRGLTFLEVSDANKVRAAKWHTGPQGIQEWTLSDWGVALAGEVGEMLNVVKKLNRVRDGIVGNKETEDELRAEMRLEAADIFHYLDLFCLAAGIDLAQAVVDKFNMVSVKHGFPDRL